MRNLNQRLYFTGISRIFLMIHLGNIYCLNYQWKTLIHLAVVWKKFFNIGVSALDNFALRKKKYSRRSNTPFMNKTLKKTRE